MIVTHRPGAALLPEAAYDEYADRGESESRNKELQRGLSADRLSADRLSADRLSADRLSADRLSADRLSADRLSADRLSADRLSADRLSADRLSDHRFLANFFRLHLHTAALNLLVRLRRTSAKAPTPQSLGIAEPLPAEALPEPARRRFFNRRRRHDPLGEGQPCTWRSRLIKVAAEITVSSRHVLVRLASRAGAALVRLAAPGRTVPHRRTRRRPRRRPRPRHQLNPVALPVAPPGTRPPRSHHLGEGESVARSRSSSQHLPQLTNNRHCMNNPG
ncbi:MAG: hypothetical protein M3552_22295 [Planctomycetota bacterium]|nr:hypothetical protein [Planctomycetota bacterium]